MTYTELGAISIFVNLPRGEMLAEDEEEILSRDVVARFEKALAASELVEDLQVLRYVSRRGCLVTVITVGISLAGLLKFIKDYPKLRRGVIAIAEDVSGMAVMLKRWDRHMRAWFYREDIVPPEELPKKIAELESHEIRSVARIKKKSAVRSGGNESKQKKTQLDGPRKVAKPTKSSKSV